MCIRDRTWIKPFCIRLTRVKHISKFCVFSDKSSVDWRKMSSSIRWVIVCTETWSHIAWSVPRSVVPCKYYYWSYFHCARNFYLFFSPFVKLKTLEFVAVCYIILLIFRNTMLIALSTILSYTNLSSYVQPPHTNHSYNMCVLCLERNVKRTTNFKTKLLTVISRFNFVFKFFL